VKRSSSSSSSCSCSCSSSTSTPRTPYRLALSVTATRSWFKAGAALDLPCVSTKTPSTAAI